MSRALSKFLDACCNAAPFVATLGPAAKVLLAGTACPVLPALAGVAILGLAGWNIHAKAKHEKVTKKIADALDYLIARQGAQNRSLRDALEEALASGDKEFLDRLPQSLGTDPLKDFLDLLRLEGQNRTERLGTLGGALDDLNVLMLEQFEGIRSALALVADDLDELRGIVIRVEAKVDRLFDRRPWLKIGEEEADQLFGSPVIPNVHAPTRDEFDRGLVYRPPIVDQVLDRLRAERVALVKGVMASGKTILGLHVALDPRFRGSACYFKLNTENLSDVSDAIDRAKGLLEGGALLILDNVHLDSQAAIQLITRRREASAGYLLLLGRSTAAIKDIREHEAAFTLETTPETLGSIVTRLMMRHNLDRRPPAEATARWHEWYAGKLVSFSRAVALMAHDLELRQWSRINRNSGLKAIRQDLNLDNTSKQRLVQLVRLAVLQELEITGLATVFEAGELEHDLKEGLIAEFHRGRWNEHRSFAFHHPQDADLVLEALTVTDKEQKLGHLIAIAQANPFVASLIVYRLIQDPDRHDDARRVLNWYGEDDDRLADHLTRGGLQYTKTRIEQCTTLSIASLERIDELLDESREAMLREAMRPTPLHFLVAFLRYAGNQLPRSYPVLMKVLREGLSGDEPWLPSRMLATPLGDLASFLGYIEDVDSTLHASVLDTLRAPGKPGRLAAQVEQRVLATPLGDLASFLGYIKDVDSTLHASVLDMLRAPGKPGRLAAQVEQRVLRTSLGYVKSFLQSVSLPPRDIHAAVLAVLKDPAIADDLKWQVLATPLGDLASFLGYIKDVDSTLHASVLDMLRAPGKPGRLAAQVEQRVLGASLGDVKSFLQSVSTPPRDIHAAVLAVLKDPANADDLKRQVLATPLEHLASFLVYVKGVEAILDAMVRAVLSDEANAVVLADRALRSPIAAADLSTFLEALGPAEEPPFLRAVELSRWQAALDTHGFSQPSAVHKLLPALAKRNRIDLARAFASHAVSIPDTRVWHQETVYPTQVSYVLRNAASASSDVIDAFVKAILTQDWLDGQYANRKTGYAQIAGAIYEVWRAHGDHLARAFTTQGLTDRVQAAISVIGWDVVAESNVVAVYHAAQLIGVCDVIGVQIGSAVPPMAPDMLRAVLDLAAKRLVGNTNVFRQEQCQFWLGLRAITRACRQPLRISPEHGDAALAGWAALDPQAEHVQHLNESMLAWLRSCKQEKWTLVSDASS